MNNVLEIINNRPLFIVTWGTSLRYFEKNIDKFKDLDVCWASLEKSYIADKILKKINKHVNIVWNDSGDFDGTLDFLWKGGKRHLITCQHYKDYFKLYNNYRTSMEIYQPKQNCGGVANFLIYLIEQRTSPIFILGADGGKIKEYGGGLYYSNEYCNHIDRENSLNDDTEKQNNSFWEWVEDINNYELEIYNCCPESLLEAFDKITLEKAIEKVKEYELLEK